METTANNYYCCDCIHYMLGVLENPCRMSKPSVGYLRKGCELWENEKGEKLPELTKVCKKCGQELSIKMFGKDKHSPDYHKDICKECLPMTKAAIKERSIAHKERLKAIAERTSKVCKICGRELPLSEFNKDRSSSDGHHYICKECFKNRYDNKKMETKVCKKCGKELPVAEFGKHYRSSDGLQSICRSCKKEIMASTNPRKKAKEAAEEEPKRIVVREKMDAQRMVDSLRADGWEVTCKKTITMEL